MRRHRNALLSARDKNDLDWLGRELVTRDWNLYATERTALFLEDRQIPVTDISTFVGKPLLGHRIMSVSREIAACVLATPDDTPEMFHYDLPQFDLVYAGLYPIEDIAREQSANFAEIRRMIDYGGRLLLSMAAYGDRLVLCRPDQFKHVLEFIDQAPSLRDEQKRAFRLGLAAEAERTVAEHAYAAAEYYRGMADLLKES